jgi:ABC-type uncharacterized transport system permease subunit
MSEMLLWAALGLYGLGIAITLPSVARRRGSLSKGAIAALAAALALHGASLLLAGVQSHHLPVPVTDVRSAISFFAFDVTLAFFLLYLRYRITSLGLFALPFAFLLVLIAALGTGPSFASPGFRGSWLTVHIASTFLGYTGFFLTFVAAVMYLIQASELKSKSLNTFYYRLPSLEVCDRLYFYSLIFGNVFLAIGLVTGFVWASRTWQGSWELDPKILASLVTWLIYLSLFSTRVSGNWGGRRSAYGAIFGFAAVMVTFLGVTFLSGQHGFFPRP